MEPINGSILVGLEEKRTKETFSVLHAGNGSALTPEFSSAGPEEVDEAASLAGRAFDAFRSLELETRARFLDTIAEKILELGDVLIERTMEETGLPQPRLEGERARTVSQLRLFADVVRKTVFLRIVTDPSLPDRKPQPRPELRMWRIPLGPVAVFGASNFPFAFSVAGGDTASALAAGCPVVVKGHPAHPGAGEMMARAVVEAARECEIPAGVFSYLPGATHELSIALVRHPAIKAVGFTGSRTIGLKLMEIAAARPEPIPVYAEMSSVNPVLLLPHALAARADHLAEQFVASLTLGAGQFCTNPGLVFAPDGVALDRFLVSAAEKVAAMPAATMLTSGICANYLRGVAFLRNHASVTCLAQGKTSSGYGSAPAALFETDAKTFMKDSTLSHEIFGASSLIVRCRNMEEMADLVDSLEGQLTMTLQIDVEDYSAAAHLIPLLEKRAGRLVVNGWPTGVEVVDAMMHGGPFPATSDGRSTSVGTAAIERFLRPLCYQNIPPALLPQGLRATTVSSANVQEGDLQ